VTDAIAVSALAARGEVGYLDHGDGADRPFWLPPRSRGRRWELAERTAAAGFDAPEDGVERALEHLARNRADLPSGTFLFVVSDFLAAPPLEAWLRPVALRWDVVPVLVQDPVWEQSFPPLASVTVTFAEPGDELPVDVRLSEADARERRHAHEERLRRTVGDLRSLGLEPLVLGTSDPRAIDREFLAWAELRRQSRRRAR
jgi:hypothetical protein